MHHILPLSLVEWYFPPAFESPQARVLLWRPAVSTFYDGARGLHCVIGSGACGVWYFLLGKNECVVMLSERRDKHTLRLFRRLWLPQLEFPTV